MQENPPKKTTQKFIASSPGLSPLFYTVIQTNHASGFRWRSVYSPSLPGCACLSELEVYKKSRGISMAAVCSDSVSDDLGCPAGTDLARALHQGVPTAFDPPLHHRWGYGGKKVNLDLERKFSVSRETLCRREASETTV